MTHLNPAFNRLVPFTPHPAFAPTPTPIYDSLCEGRPSPELELRFIQHLTAKYSEWIQKVWDRA